MKGYPCRAMRLPGFAEPYEAFAKHDRQDWLQAIAEEVTSLHAPWACFERGCSRDLSITSRYTVRYTAVSL